MTKRLNRSRHAKLLGLSPLALAVMASCTSGLVMAQSDTKATAMEEVTVTARRRDESLAEVPIAITAMNAEQLKQEQIQTDSDLQIAVPGLTIRQTQGNNSLTYSIRGQTADTFSGSPSAVVTYFNDVPLTIASASALFDLESIQVLKGPQGTLFGRNATGGAVLFNPAKPTDETTGKMTVRVGNQGMREVDAMYNTPLIEDTLLMRVAFNGLNKDGYIDNEYTGTSLTGEVDKDLGKIERRSGRISLTWTPNDVLENTFVGQYSRIEGTNTGASYVYSIYGAGETNNGFNLNSNSSFLAGEVDTQKQLGLYKTRHPAGADHIGDDWIVTNTTTYEISDNLTFKNILGASATNTDSEQPQLGAPFATILTANIVSGESGNESDSKSISDEMQLQGMAFDGKLDYIVGLYLQNYRVDTLWPQTYFELPAQALTDNFRVTNESRAVYAQGTYDLSDAVEGLKATAGVRYTREKVGMKQLPKSTYKFGAADQHDTFSKPSWELGLEYQASDELMTYVKTRGSFRSGGFNGAAPAVNANATQGGNKFDSETVKDIEVGTKYRGMMMDRPVSLDIAIYKAWIEDVQRVEFPIGPGGTSIAVTANVPEMQVQGFEMDASILATDWLELGLAFTYTDADFTDGDINLFGADYSYGPVGDTPKMSGSAYFMATLPMDSDNGELTLRTDIYSQASQLFSNAADSIAPRTELPSYNLVNTRLSWNNMMGSQFSGAVFAKNLTDEEYFVGGMTLAAALGHNAAAVGEPRTFGVELTYDF